MANTKKRRKIIIFSLLGLGLAGLTTAAILKKREVVISVQTERVGRSNITEIVEANGKIQPVLQVKISPEVSGEIIELPVKEGQSVKKGDLVLKIKPDFYIASRNQAEASYKSSLAAQATAEANLRKAEAEFKRTQALFDSHLIAVSVYDGVKADYDVAQAQLTNSVHQVEMSFAQLASAEDALAKTTIVSPITGTISRLNSEVGERVVGTATMAGTEVMTIADLNEMEARVDIGEVDVVLIAPGQKARLEVDAFKDRKFNGTVTEIANSSGAAGLQAAAAASSANNQEATKFSVKIRIQEKEPFRPGMSVTAEIETRYRANVLTVPIASVTTRIPKPPAATNTAKALALNDPPGTNSTKSKDIAPAVTNVAAAQDTNIFKAGRRNEPAKPVEVVFVVDGDHVKMVPVKIGISDDLHWEITDGLKEGDEVISGGYRAVSRDLEDGKKIKKGAPSSPGDEAELKKTE